MYNIRLQKGFRFALRRKLREKNIKKTDPFLPTLNFPSNNNLFVYTYVYILEK